MMADITMCQATSDSCSKAKQCRRNAASGTVPDPRYQSYAEFKHNYLGCDNFREPA